MIRTFLCATGPTLYLFKCVEAETSPVGFMVSSGIVCSELCVSVKGATTLLLCHYLILGHQRDFKDELNLPDQLQLKTTSAPKYAIAV